MDAKKYREQMKALLSPVEKKILQKLSTPKKIQDYLDSLKVNFEVDGETLMSPRRVMRTGRAHCIEAALLAAAALAYHGRPPYLMDFQTREYDEDHVVAVFEDGGLWGAISKTNHAVLRWRDGVYSSPRELAMSYFHEYTMNDGRKTMLAYSEPFDMRQYPLERWLTVEEDTEWFADDIDESPHFPAAPAKVLRTLRPTAQIERKILLLIEEKDPRKKK